MSMNRNRQGEQPQDDRNNAAGAQQEDRQQLGDSLSGSIQSGQSQQGGNRQSAQQGNAQSMQLDAEEKPADQLTAEELRLMADTMPGDGPGDD